MFYYLYILKVIDYFISLLDDQSFLIRVRRYLPFDTGLRGSIDLSECFRGMGSSSEIGGIVTRTGVAAASTAGAASVVHVETGSSEHVLSTIYVDLLVFVGHIGVFCQVEDFTTFNEGGADRLHIGL